MDESCCAALPVLATCDMAIATCRLQIVLVLITLEQNCSPGDRSSVEDQIFAESLADAEMLRILGDPAVPKVGLKLDFDCTCHPDKHACHITSTSTSAVDISFLRSQLTLYFTSNVDARKSLSYLSIDLGSAPRTPNHSALTESFLQVSTTCSQHSR